MPKITKKGQSNNKEITLVPFFDLEYVRVTEIRIVKEYT